MIQDDYEFYHNRLLEITSDITDLGQEAYNTSESMPLYVNEPYTSTVAAVKAVLFKLQSLIGEELEVLDHFEGE